MNETTTNQGGQKVNTAKLEIITTDHEYFDDVNFVWRPVPSFWVGDFVRSHSHVVKNFKTSK